MKSEIKKVVTYSEKRNCRYVCYKVIIDGRAVDSYLDPERAKASLSRYIRKCLQAYVDSCRSNPSAA